MGIAHHGESVLVVDDNSDLRRILRVALEFYGYRVLEAENGRTAIQMVLSENPDLILLDLTLPDVEGTSVAETLKKNSETAFIPIIGCSAYLGTEWREKALGAGMDAYLEKPISLDEIAAAIEHLLPRHSLAS